MAQGILRDLDALEHGFPPVILAQPQCAGGTQQAPTSRSCAPPAAWKARFAAFAEQSARTGSYVSPKSEHEAGRPTHSRHQDDWTKLARTLSLLEKSKVEAAALELAVSVDEGDPMDEAFMMTLHSNEDEGKIAKAHMIIRRDVLEVRRTVSGKIFFQCRCCSLTDRPGSLSTIAPRSLEVSAKYV